MAEPRPSRRRLFDRSLVAACVAVLAGLPLAVAMREDGDMARSSMARPRDALIVSAPVRLLSLLALSIDSGVLHGPNPSSWKGNDQLDRLEIDSAGFSLNLSESPLNAEERTANRDSLESVLVHLASLNARSIGIRRSHIDFVRPGEKTLRLTEFTADITQPRRDAFVAQGTARYRGGLVKFEASWTRPADGKAPAIYPLKLKISGRAIEASIDGRLDLTGEPRIEGRSEIHSPKVRQLLRWLGLPVSPENDLRNAAITGDLSWTKAGIAISKASVSIDGNEAVGSVMLSMAAKRPKVDATLAFKSFALDRYVLGLLADGHQSASNGSPPTDHHRSILALVDADLRLSAAKIVASHLELGRGALTIALKEGRLLADLAELEIEGGSMTGQISLDVADRQPRLGLKLRTQQIDPGRALTNWMKRNPLLGRANVVFEGTSSGGTLVELLRALDGRGTFELIGGGRLGIDIKALAHVAPAETAVGWAAAGKGNTPLTGLDARYALSKGNLKLEAVTARSGNTTFLGTGWIDLYGQLLDLSIAHGTGNLSEVPVSSREILRLHGSWLAPLIGILQAPPAVSTVPAIKGSSLKGSSPLTDAKDPVPVTVERGSQPFDLVP